MESEAEGVAFKRSGGLACIAELALMLMKAFGLELHHCLGGCFERNLSGKPAGIKLLEQDAKGILRWEMYPSLFCGIYLNFGYVSYMTFSAWSVGIFTF